MTTQIIALLISGGVLIVTLIGVILKIGANNQRLVTVAETQVKLGEKMDRMNERVGRLETQVARMEGPLGGRRD